MYINKSINKTGPTKARWLIACQPSGESPPEELASPNEGSPSGAHGTSSIPGADAVAVLSAWQICSHAQSYVVDDLGNNSACTRCHAPANYVPALDEIPESCFVCKFELSEPPPLTPQDAWTNIQCNVCHELDKKGNIQGEYSWLEVAALGQYTEVASTTELCRKCHTEADAPPGHSVIDLTDAHAEYTCTQCHDAHTTTASCVSENCHADVSNPSPPIAGHDDDHKLVACEACHDAAGLEAVPDEQRNWLTFQPASSIPFASHNIAKNVVCERCHHLNNPWNLSEEVSR